jgi:hypothetical protein
MHLTVGPTSGIEQLPEPERAQMAQHGVRAEADQGGLFAEAVGVPRPAVGTSEACDQVSTPELVVELMAGHGGQQLTSRRDSTSTLQD